MALVAELARRGWWAAVPAYLLLAVRGAQLAIVDLREHRLPNRWTLGSIPWLIPLLAAASVVHGRSDALIAAAIGALGTGLFYLVLAVAVPSGLGMGDVKLALVLGCAVGWWSTAALPVAVLLTFVVGGLTALALLIARRATRRTEIAFGPAMLVGSWLALMATGT